MRINPFALALTVLLWAGCAPTWQAPAGLSPEAQASDQTACEEDARQAAVAQIGSDADAMAQTGSAGDVELARLEAFIQCLEARGWRLQKRAP
jgi:outer membrane murein-binding lipoprotein Lpp